MKGCSKWLQKCTSKLRSRETCLVGMVIWSENILICVLGQDSSDFKGWWAREQKSMLPFLNHLRKKCKVKSLHMSLPYLSGISGLFGCCCSFCCCSICQIFFLIFAWTRCSYVFVLHLCNSGKGCHSLLAILSQ